MTEIKGIDVSRWQSTIDWKKVKADGVKFAMLRCGTGYKGGVKDNHFEYNYKNAKAAGIAVGAYFYSYALTVEQAKEEADRCLNYISGKDFEYPVVFDIEDSTQVGLGKSLISEMCRAFCEKIKAAGFIPCIYSNVDWLKNRIDDDCKNKYDIWLAQWNNRVTYTGNYKIWQYTSSGTVKGIKGRVDMNISYFDYAAATVEKPVETVEKSVDELAKEVLNGVYGNGDERKAKLGKRYAEVQKRVNEMIAENAEKAAFENKSVDELAKEVLDGVYGNGDERKAKLGKRYAEVQKRVNEMIAEKPPQQYEKIVLKQKPLFTTAYDLKTNAVVNGTFYFYDGINVNGKYRITNSKDKCGKKPYSENVTGYIEI